MVVKKQKQLHVKIHYEKLRRFTLYQSKCPLWWNIFVIHEIWFSKVLWSQLTMINKTRTTCEKQPLRRCCKRSMTLHRLSEGGRCRCRADGYVDTSFLWSKLCLIGPIQFLTLKMWSLSSTELKRPAKQHFEISAGVKPQVQHDERFESSNMSFLPSSVRHLKLLQLLEMNH